MPTCLDCEIRVPPVEEWERVNGRRVKPCACGLPEAKRKAALVSQGEYQYSCLVQRWADYGLPAREIVIKVRGAGNHEWDRVVTTMWRRYGWQQDDPRTWAKFYDDLLAHIPDNVARERQRMKSVKYGLQDIARALRLSVRQVIMLRGARPPIDRYESWCNRPLVDWWFR